MLHGLSDNDGNKKFQITLVDAGMVAQLTEEESATFIGMLTCIGDGDGAAAAEFALRFSVDNNISEKSRESFKKEMVKFFEKNCRGYGTDVDVGEVFRGVLGLIREHGIRIDANYATLVINVLCIEGLGRRICPSYNVLDAARPLLQTYRRVVYRGDGYTPKSKNAYSKVITKCTHRKQTRMTNKSHQNFELLLLIEGEEANAIHAVRQQEARRQRVLQAS